MTNRVKRLAEIKGKEPNVRLRFKHGLEFMSNRYKSGRGRPCRAKSKLVREIPVRDGLGNEWIKVPAYNHFFQNTRENGSY